MDLKISLTATALAYALLLAGMLWWHISQGEPYFEARLGLLLVFSMCAAIVGLISVWATLGALHWARHASVSIIGTAMLVGVCLQFSPWRPYLIWQMVVMVVAQMGCQLLFFGMGRLLGVVICKQENASAAKAKAKLSQFSIRDLFLLTTAFAIFFAVLRTAQPTSVEAKIYAILFIGGSGTALVNIGACGLCFSNIGFFNRLVAGVLIAPLGGAVYAILSHFESLMFSWQWYAYVTSLQMLFMILPLILLRRHGYQFARVARNGAGKRELGVS